MVTTEASRMRAREAAESVEPRHHRHHDGGHKMVTSDLTILSIYGALTLGAIAGSVALFALRRRDEAIFTGLWAPTFLGMGLMHRALTSAEERAEEEEYSENK